MPIILIMDTEKPMFDKVMFSLMRRTSISKTESIQRYQNFVHITKNFIGLDLFNLFI